MRFLFGDRELVLTVGTLLSAQADSIIIPAGPELGHEDPLAQEVIRRAGERVREESTQLMREYGAMDYGMAVFTTAGDLPFRAIIHAVVPGAGANDPGRVLEQALSRSLQLCDLNEWRSLACPVLDLSESGLSISDISMAYFHVITHFWDARQECALEKVVIYATQDQFRPFFDAFREQGFTEQELAAPISSPAGSCDEQVGEIELSEDEVAAQDNSDIDGWFK